MSGGGFGGGALLDVHDKLLARRIAAMNKRFEPFAGDEYLNGPEYEAQVEPGGYLIRVSNPENSGQYVLAIGKIESFPPVEIIKTFITLPGIKSEYFNKPWYDAFLNLSGGFLLVLLIVFER